VECFRINGVGPSGSVIRHLVTLARKRVYIVAPRAVMIGVLKAVDVG
jgi:hypothetical protein